MKKTGLDKVMLIPVIATIEDQAFPLIASPLGVDTHAEVGEDYLFLLHRIRDCASCGTAPDQPR